MHARNEGVSMVFIHALTENTAMLKIARKAGATVQRDGSESEAYLEIPPASFDTRSSARPSSSGTFWPMCRKCARAYGTAATSRPNSARIGAAGLRCRRCHNNPLS